MSVNTKMKAIADAIRGKTGKAEEMTLDQMATEIAGIETGGGGGIEPTASYLTLRELSQTIAAYPFKPKHKNELIVWNTTGEIAPDNGSMTPYAFFAWIINGIPHSECAWIYGAATTAPWTDENYVFARRSQTFSLDDSGNFTVITGTWGFMGQNNTCTIYEIPLPIGLEV